MRLKYFLKGERMESKCKIPNSSHLSSGWEWSGIKEPQLYLKLFNFLRIFLKTCKEKKGRREEIDTLEHQRVQAFLTCLVLSWKYRQPPPPGGLSTEPLGWDPAGCARPAKAGAGWQHHRQHQGGSSRKPWPIRCQDSCEESQLSMPPKWVQGLQRGRRVLHFTSWEWQPFPEEGDEQASDSKMQWNKELRLRGQTGFVTKPYFLHLQSRNITSPRTVLRISW